MSTMGTSSEVTSSDGTGSTSGSMSSPARPGRHLMDGGRCTRCAGQELDLDAYAADPQACPPRWLDEAELAAADAARLALALADSKACVACGSLHHGTEDCV